MKRFKYLLHLIVILAALSFSSCTKDDPDPEILPVDINADNQWLESEIQTDEVLWFRVTADESHTSLYVEWAEADHHGENKSYSADIEVSAYMLDGVRPYFENKNNGYGADIKSFSLESEFQVLLKVELNDDGKPGSFAIRSTGTGDTAEISYEQLDISDSWTDGNITEEQTIGYLVDCGDHEQVQIIWAEADSPEEGYTSDIQGSVFHLDGETPYKDLGNGKDILNKNKSHSDDPKYIQLDPSEKEIKIHISVNSAPGSYAIKVVGL